MPQGPLGGSRPFSESKLSIIVAGDPRNPPSAEEIQNIIGGLQPPPSTPYISNIVEDTIDTDDMEGISSDGVIQVVVIEFHSDSVLSLNRYGEDLMRIEKAIEEDTNCIGFLSAR